MRGSVWKDECERLGVGGWVSEAGKMGVGGRVSKPH